jgi:hypothetical protein
MAHLPPAVIYPDIFIRPRQSRIWCRGRKRIFLSYCCRRLLQCQLLCTRDGLNDATVLSDLLPVLGNFQSRYLSTGGAGYAISSGKMSLPGGLIYGAVAGLTDRGFVGNQDSAINIFLVANGTRNW